MLLKRISFFFFILAADTSKPAIPETQVCVPYNGTTCRAYLQGRLVMHHPTETLQQRDAELEAQLKEIEDLELFADTKGGYLCEEPARRLLCHMAFPDCHNETHQAVPICQESCQAVKSVFCFQHLSELEDMKSKGKVRNNVGLLNLPDCLTLPSKWNSSESCVESDHHGFSPSIVRDDCYMERGRWYNGTVRFTKSGIPCQAWLDMSPHKHDRSPLIFPELIGAENFCRNPGGEESQPWCYTTSTESRWEVCDINMCDLDVSENVSSPQDYPKDYFDFNISENVSSPNDYREEESEDDLNLFYIVGACVLVTVCISVGILCFLVRHCRRTQNTASSKEDVDINVENLPLNSAYHQMKSNRLNPKLETLEFPRNDIVFIEDIGQGAFGRVFKARIVCSGGNCHSKGGKLSDSKHSLSSGKNCRHKNTFTSKGDIRPVDTSLYSKYYDSKLLGEHLSMLCDHDRDIGYKDCELVAVKMLKDDASETIQADFEREASLMVEFDHVNIVRLLGVCTVGRPMCLLFEYMSRGDLNEFLRLCSPDQCLRRGNTESTLSLQETSSVTVQDQLHMARQIAGGMLYLSDRGYVHRDLATRNCLVGDNLTVKISDFGLARSVHSMDYYHGSDKDAIPVRWMPPEAILYNKFSTQSDVWSFGVLLWEIFSFALQPYYGMTHEEVVDYLRAGKVLPAPDYGPSSVYELMKLCWHRKPLSRPTFVSLHKSLNVLHEEVSKLKLMNAANV
ncbi:hypothetical protein BsWGS_19361 [Bradybaena similaris]